MPNLENKEIEVFLGADDPNIPVKYANLPEEYQQVEYIEATGTQYILPNVSTDVSNYNSFRFETEIQWNEITNYQMNGANEGQNFGANKFSAFGIQIRQYVFGTQSTAITPSTTNFDVIKFNGNYNTKVCNYNVNGTAGQFTRSSDFVGGDIGIFALPQQDVSPTQKCNCKMRYFKFYQDTTLILNCIPCYRKSDNEIGMYDLVNDVFYTNDGTGTFNKGNDIIRTYYINYGKFIVNQAPENDTTNGTIKITAFDYMIKFNDLYTPNVEFPCTIKQMLDDVCTTCGVTLATQDFANKDFMVDSNQFDGKTNRDVLRHIGKCAFSWVRIGQDNQLYLDFAVSNTVTENVGITDFYQDNYKKANEEFGPVNRVVYAESNIEGQEEKVEDTDSIALYGLHELVIYDNYFAYTTAFRQELIQAGIRLFGLKFMPVQDLKMVGLAYLDCTDIIQVTDTDNNSIKTIPLNHIIEYNGSISDSVSSEMDSETETTYKNTNSPINANSLTEIVVDRARREIKQIVDYYVNFLHSKTGNNNIFISGTRDGEGFIPRFIVKGNTNIFNTLQYLPEGYQELEYIESTGTQYIDTGFKPTYNRSFDIKASYVNGECLFGLYSQESRIDFFEFNLFKTSIENEFKFEVGDNSSKTYIYADYEKPHNYKVNAIYRNMTVDTDLYIDDELITTVSSYIELSKNLYLFAKNDNNEDVTSFGSWRIYEAKFYNRGILSKHLIPCYRKSDGEIGLYDIINDEFFTNSGTGTFEKGKEIYRISLVASEGIKNQETALITESEDTILTETEDALLTESSSLNISSHQIILNDILRNLTIGDTTYYDELQILQDGTIQIIKRIGVSSGGILYLLDKEEIIVLDDKYVIPSRENGLYYYIDELDNLDYYAEYIIKNEYSDMFATEAYVNAGLSLKVDTSKLISELNASADIIRLVGQRLIIQMKNFSLDETGYMNAIAGQIAGFNMDDKGFYKDYSLFYNFSKEDVMLLMSYLNDYADFNSSLEDFYKITGNQNISILDAIKMIRIVNGEIPSESLIEGQVSIDSDETNSLIEVTNSINVEKTRTGVFSMYCYLISANTIVLGDYTNSGVTGIIIDKLKKKISLVASNAETTILPTGITTPSVTQTSKAEDKKDFEKLETALEEVMNTDIYTYHLKTQEDTDKKHVGFVIGKDFKYSNLITAEDEKGEEIGVDTYSMVSVLWKAVQEQQKEIEELKEEIKKMKGDK